MIKTRFWLYNKPNNRTRVTNVNITGDAMEQFNTMHFKKYPSEYVKSINFL